MSRPILASVLAAALILGSLMALPEEALACSCASATLERQYEWSEAVFAGEATDVSTDRTAPGPARHAIFRVAEVWKGPEQETIEVTTPLSGASCGYNFEEGKEYLVYADRGLNVNLCSATSQISLQDVDLSTLPVGQPPTPDDLPDTGGGHWPLYWAAVIAVVLGTAAVIAAAKSRQRSDRSGMQKGRSL